MNRRRCLLVYVTGLLLCPISTDAQPATSFSELRRILRPGDEVLVRHADGRLTREHVRAVTDLALDVQPKAPDGYPAIGPTRSLAEASVTEVKREDSPLTGFVIGIGAGIVATYAACRSGCISFYAYPAGAAGGGVVGSTIDYVIRQTVFRSVSPRSGTATIAITPWFMSHGGGTSLTLQF